MTLPEVPVVNDIFFIIILMWALTLAMRKHGQWRRLTEFGDFVAWLLITCVIFGVTKLLVIGIWLGFKIPVEASDEEHTIAATITIIFWVSMMYWRIPGRMLNIFIKPKEKENPQIHQHNNH